MNTPSSTVVRTARQMVLAGTVFAALAWLSIALTRGANGIASVWLPNALALVLFVRCRFAHPAAILAATTLGNVLASLVAGRAFELAIGLAGCNAAEIAVAVLLVRQWCGAHPDMSELGTQMRFIAASALIPPAVSATLALALLQPLGPAGSATAWSSWALTDGLGMLMVAPAAMIVSEPGRRLMADLTARGTLEWAVFTALGIAATLGVFLQNDFPFLFLVLPFVLLAAFRLGMLATAFSVIQVAVIATVCTWLGHGPINLIPHPLATKLIVLQCFLATAFSMGLPVAAALAGQARLTARIGESEAKLALLADNVTDAVIRIESDGICSFASPSAATLFGLPVSEIIGRNFGELVEESDLAATQLQVSAIGSSTFDQDLFSFRSRAHAARGETVWIEINCGAVEDPNTGLPAGYIASARNVSARVELETQLDRARRHAESAVAAKSQFLANMSHDIRTPMNGVLGYAQLLLQEPLLDRPRHHAQMIADSGQRMMRLLNDILDLSKIEAGQMVVCHEPVALHDLIVDCARLMRANAGLKGVSIEVEITTAVPAEVVGDALRLRQILLNLIGNAVKFTPSGQITVEVAIVEGVGAGVGAGVVAGNIEITVSDTGIGIAQDHMEAIFRPFDQGVQSVTRRFGGSGLGLSISRQLAEMLGGTLTAQSREGQGSRFVLSIPLIEAEAEGAHALAPLPEVLAAPMQPPPSGHVLLVEDNDINRFLAREMLVRLGQRVTVAVDGEEAIAAVAGSRNNGAPFDLVLMDVQMPICGGYEATRAIRAAGNTPSGLPIVALTANAYREDIAEAAAAGMQDHLAKPLDFAALAAVLRRWLPVTSEVLPVSQPAATPPAPDDALTQRWLDRRSEALEKVAAYVRMGAANDTTLADLAATMHKLAGTAGMFGEDALGEQARGLEDAIRRMLPPAAVTELAETMLRAA